MNQHSKTVIHVSNEKLKISQRTFKTSAGSLTGCFKPTAKDQILNAEILQALNMVDKNHSFSSANGDSDRFKKMFSDSQIAAKYSQYCSICCLVPFVKVKLITDVQKTPYSLNLTKLQIPK